MLKLTPHKYQNRAVNLIKKHGSVYLMLDAGLGKTAICLLTARSLNLPMIVFGPLLAVTETWPSEIEKWAPELSYTILHGPNKNHRLSQAHTADIVLLNYEGIKWFFNACNAGKVKLRKFFAVFDESSMIKYRTKETMTGGLPRFEMLAQMMPIYSPYRVCLSATPAGNSLMNLWSQYFLLDEGKALTKSFWSFKRRYFNDTGHPRYQVTLKPFAEEGVFDAVKDLTYQLNAEEELNMPKLRYNMVELEMPRSLRIKYEQMKEEYILQFQDGDISTANSQATADHKLRQLLQGGIYTEAGLKSLKSSPKARYLKEMVDSATGNPILCAIQFKFEHEQINKVFRRKVPIIAGKTSAAEAKRLIAAWNRKELPLLLAHPASVGYSLNLQQGGHDLVWLAQPWSFEHFYQMIRRLYRQGQERGVTSHHVVFKNSIDEKIAAYLWKYAAQDSRLKQAMKEGGLK